jgi:hypothetical protein
MKELFDLRQDKTGYKVSVVPSTLENGKVKRGQPYLLGNFLGMTEKEGVGPISETNYTLTFEDPDRGTLTTTSMKLDNVHDFYKIILESPKLESPKSPHQYPTIAASKLRSASRKTQSHSGGRRRSKRSRKLRR